MGNAFKTAALLTAMTLFLLFMGICELIWFFPFAAAFSLLAGVISLYAYFNTRLIWNR